MSNATEKEYQVDLEKGTGVVGNGNSSLLKSGVGRGRPNSDSDSPGLEDFYNKNVFVCEGDGRPIWCSMCLIWKPDRSHHCREVDRCVRKMDHYCPWQVVTVSVRCISLRYTENAVEPSSNAP